MNTLIHVVATTISGSIRDWKKVEQIQPLFAKHGFKNVQLHVVDTHAAARAKAKDIVFQGHRVLISAGGSGTFNAVLEGCCDAGAPLPEIRLGFLRKGSADLIGKVLGMPDEIGPAVSVFADSIRAGSLVPCDVLQARSRHGGLPRRFVGYGGAEIFGRIPHFTENRFIKWYKGILSQVIGDLGPFTTGMSLALMEKMMRAPWGRRSWRVLVDGKEVARGRYQALIIVNGYLGPDMAFSDDALGSERFHLFALRDQGMWRLPAQARQSMRGTIMKDSHKWGMEHHVVTQNLALHPQDEKEFPLNVDGSTLICSGGALISRIDTIQLIAQAS